MNDFSKAKEIAAKNSIENHAIQSEQDKALSDNNLNENFAEMPYTQAFQQNKKKVTYIDDGRSIADMNIEGFSWYNKRKFKEDRQSLVDLRITFKERLAMILGALSVMLPIVLMMGLLFFGVFLFIYLWMR